MDLVTLGLGIGGIAIVPLGAVVKKSYRNETRISTLEANYANLDAKLTDVAAKLDRLIEKFL